MAETSPCQTEKMVRNFEDLNVFKRAREFANQVYDITRQPSFSKDPDLQCQLRRASVSIISNIAEGFERGTKRQFINFLYIAKGSSGEARAQIIIACDQKYISQETFQSLNHKCKMISGMIGNFISYLKRKELENRSIQNKTKK